MYSVTLYSKQLCSLCQCCFSARTVRSDWKGIFMKDYLIHIVKHLVDNPDEVKVSEVFGETTVVYELKVAQPDMGKVIGKNGRTAHAIRVLLSAVARKAGKHATLEILE